MTENWRGGAEYHPWHTIAEELLARGWSIDDLAIRMTFPDYDNALKELAKNRLVLDMYSVVGPNTVRCRIGGKSGKAIARAFGVSDDLFVNLERAWRDAQP